MKIPLHFAGCGPILGGMIVEHMCNTKQERESPALHGDTALMLSLLSGVASHDLERYLRHSSLLAKLADDLRIVEQRLGTELERAADLDQAQLLGHQIRNVLCMTVLADEARTMFAGCSQSGTPFPACA